MDQIEIQYTSPATTATLPNTSERKRTHSTLSERRYRDSLNTSALMEEIQVYTSNDVGDQFSVENISEGWGTAESKRSSKLLNYNIDVKHNKCESQQLYPNIPPTHSHNRRRSCHQRKPSLLINANPRSAEEAIEEVRKSHLETQRRSKDLETQRRSRASSKGVSFWSEIEELGNSAIKHEPQRRQVSHTRTASDFDSVILIGKDDSSAVGSPVSSSASSEENVPLDQIFQMIESGGAGSANKFILTPGKISFTNASPANNPITAHTTAHTQPAVQPDWAEQESKEIPKNKQVFNYEASIRASANELVLTSPSVMPFCKNCNSYVVTKMDVQRREPTAFDKMCGGFLEMFCGTCYTPNSQSVVHVCSKCLCNIE